MPKKLLKCPTCGNYTFNYIGHPELCSKCGEKYISPHPAKFSMHTNPKYLQYIRKLKKLTKNK